ncbi:MAG: hypothetical protein JST32_16330 [Bacteroidetes bacterium]|nr:hypothetical protein [Bacteroidota bacterium]
MKESEFGDRAYTHKAHFRKKMIFIPFLVLAGLALVSYVVMLLWNALMPVIFHLTVITYWQAAGLLILCKILFGFGKGGPRGGAPWMRHRMKERWMNMSPEEQERFREQMRERCGKWGGHHDRYGWGRQADAPAKPAEEAQKPTE